MYRFVCLSKGYGLLYVIVLTPSFFAGATPPEMVDVPAGWFQMGRPYTDEGQYDEVPVHDVYLDAYQIGKYPVTNQEYADVLNWALDQGYITNPGGDVYTGWIVSAYGKSLVDTATSNYYSQISYSDDVFSVRSRDGFPMSEHPVVRVSWYGALVYCNWLSIINGLQPCYNTMSWTRFEPVRNGYRLPTEAEWERAAAWDGTKHWRYGITKDFINFTYANYHYSSRYANPLGLTSYPYTSPVGWYHTKSPVGAYDMCGNVWEWCQDYYSMAYTAAPVSNPTGPDYGTYNTVRGGCWYNTDYSVRVANREYNSTINRDYFTGFRISRSLEGFIVEGEPGEGEGEPGEGEGEPGEGEGEPGEGEGEPVGDGCMWAKCVGGNGLDRSNALTIDNNGNVYTTGQFRFVEDFDPGTDTFYLTPGGTGDTFISKFDSNGDFIWAKNVGSLTDGTFDFFNEGGRDISVDSNGNVYVVGIFMGSADFDPGAGLLSLNSNGYTDIFVLKLDENGNTVWANSFGLPVNDYGEGIDLDSESNVYICGRIRDTDNVLSSVKHDIFIAKIDTDGNLIWSKTIGGSETDACESLIISNDNIYATGYFSGTVDFDPGSGINAITSTGVEDAYVLKLDTDGNFIWVKNMGGTENTRGIDIKVDNEENIYTTGCFSGTVDFNPGTETYNLTSITGGFDGWDIFVSKLDTNGNFIWAKSVGGSDDDESSAIYVDNIGNSYTVGNFAGTVDLDPGPNTYNLTSLGGVDIFKLDANGDFIWAKSLGGSLGNDIAVKDGSSVYTTGYFSGTVDFDPSPGIYNLTGNDYGLFVLKLCPEFLLPNVSSIVISNISSMCADTVDFTVTFDESVEGFDNTADIIIEHDGTTHEDITISGSGDEYIVTVSGISGIGSFTIAVNPLSDVRDIWANPLASSVTSESAIINSIPVSIISGPMAVNITSTTANIIWSTNEPTTSVVHFNEDGGSSTISEDLGLYVNHTVTLTELTPETLYYYTVSSTDGRGCNTVVSEEQYFMTNSAEIPLSPVIIEGPLVVKVTHYHAVIRWRTDVNTQGWIRYGFAPDSLNMQSGPIGGSRNVHNITLNNLEMDTTYYFCAYSEDALGNAVESAILWFKTPAAPGQCSPPVFIAPPSICSTNSTAVFSWKTNEPSDTELWYGIGDTDILGGYDPEPVMDHEVTITGLVPGETYMYQASSTNWCGQVVSNGNIAHKEDASFVISADPDTVPPAITSGPIVSNVTSTAATLQWTTDEIADSRVVYDVWGEGLSLFKGELTHVLEHTLVLTNLIPSTTYEFQVSSKDLSGNGPTSSTTLTLTTVPEPDTSAPIISLLPNVSDLTETSAILSWGTDELATSQVIFGTIPDDLRDIACVTGVQESHAVLLVGLSQGTTYYYTAVSMDQWGNQTYSDVEDFTTLGGPEGEGELPMLEVFALGDTQFTKTIGENVTFIITASGEVGPLSYQWYRVMDNKASEIISDATQPYHTILNLQENDESDYQCQVYDAGTDAYAWSPVFNLILESPMPIASAFFLLLTSASIFASGVVVIKRRRK